MIGTILELLKEANGETETIRIAQGKNKLPKTFTGILKKYKRERKWQ